MNNEISYFFLKRLKFKVNVTPLWPSHPAIFLGQSRKLVRWRPLKGQVGHTKVLLVSLG